MAISDVPVLPVRTDYRSPEVARVVPVHEHEGWDALVQHLQDYGHVVADLSSCGEPRDALDRLTSALQLHEPYVPVMYRGRGEFDEAVTEITRSDSGHPAISREDGQPFHTDGFLDPIGSIRTSVLYCVARARSGGQTIVLDAVALFQRLLSVDAPAASTLLQPQVLERVASLPGVSESSIGPVFAWDGARLLNRFADGPTERWHPAEGTSEALDRALKFFRDQAREDGEFRRSVMLEPGQVLILENDRVSHARGSYESDPANPRKLLRAMFPTAPHTGCPESAR